ncbi:glutathione S-transferase [Sphingomonas sp. C8-2]|jgi:glutathione S-transferase|nr:glutathione S-transferase [Sphingomonas sp. C8-2]
MKLHWSPSAPFVRKVMVAAHALGLADRIECVRSRVGPTRLNAELMVDNPLNKVPTLVLPDGTSLYDSRVICDYLDALAGGGLVPVEPVARWRVLRWQCLADGMLDVTILLRDEHFRGDGHRSTAHLAAYAAKMRACLDAMEKEADALATAGLDIGSIATGVALAYLDFRAPALEWRQGRPRLAAWESAFAEQPAMVAAPFGDEVGTKFAFYAME